MARSWLMSLMLVVVAFVAMGAPLASMRAPHGRSRRTRVRPPASLPSHHVRLHRMAAGLRADPGSCPAQWRSPRRRSVRSASRSWRTSASPSSRSCRVRSSRLPARRRSAHSPNSSPPPPSMSSWPASPRPGAGTDCWPVAAAAEGKKPPLEFIEKKLASYCKFQEKEAQNKK